MLFADGDALGMKHGMWGRNGRMDSDGLDRDFQMANNDDFSFDFETDAAGDRIDGKWNADLDLGLGYFLAKASETASSTDGRYLFGPMTRHRRKPMSISMPIVDRIKSRLSTSISYFGEEIPGGRYNRMAQLQIGDPWWVSQLFPAVPVVTREPKPNTLTPWSKAARRLAESLLRTDELARLDGGLRIDRTAQHFDIRRDRLSSESDALTLVSPQSWLTRTGGGASQTLVQWCDGKQRAVFSKAFLLGRTRETVDGDLTRPPLSLSGYVTQSVERSYQVYTAEIQEGKSEGRSLLVLTHPNSPGYSIELLIDTVRDVLLKIEHKQDGKVSNSTEHSEFVEVAGAWWATKIETFNEKRQRTSLITQTFKAQSSDEFGKAVERQLADLPRVQLVNLPLVSTVDAKRAVAMGKDTFDDRLRLLLHFHRNQQWDTVVEHLDAAERLAEGRPGMRFLRNAILYDARRRENLRKRLMKQATRLANSAKAIDAYFLAEQVRSRASGILELNEMLRLLDALRPVYERQPAHLFAMKKWTQQRINYLQSTGQAEDALKLRLELAKEYPFDQNLQVQYANALVTTGDYPAAYAWLDKTLADNAADWTAYEKDSLRGNYAQFLRQQGRYEDLVKFFEAWIEDHADTSQAYQQYLTALIRTDQTDRADELIAQWLADGQKEEKLTAGEAARLSAAVSQMLGQGYNMHTNRLDEKWLAPLGQAAFFFAGHKTQGHIADRIMGHDQFRRSDECRDVRRKAARTLVKQAETLEFIVIQRMVNWVLSNDPAVEKKTWQRITTVLEARWADASEANPKNQWAGLLIRVLPGHIGAEEHLAFLRRQLTEGPQDHRPSYANQLFQALLSQKWQAAYEDEAFDLLMQLSDAKDPTERLFAQIHGLHQLNDRMVRARFDARMAKLEHPEKLTRTELREKQTENLLAARTAMIDRLKRASREHDAALAAWILVERLNLEVRAERDLDKVAEACWEVVGSRPGKLPEEMSAEQSLERMRQGRCLSILCHLTARRSAKPARVTRLLGYIDAGLKDDPQDEGWRGLKFQMLVALDRPEPLEKALREWNRTDDPATGWQLPLGYLLAEQGKIREAITLFEAVKATDQLDPAQCRTLANWYLVVDRREDHEQALIDVFMMMEEWRMSNWLSQKLNPWQRGDGHLPTELDKDVLRMFAALFQKSGSPQNHTDQLRRFYQASRDFRLLESLADGVVGHTAGKVYPFLGSMRSVLGEVRDEATADSIVERLAVVRERAKTEVDRRALDLLEVMVERRSSEVMNQPGPHVELALAAHPAGIQRRVDLGRTAPHGRFSRKSRIDFAKAAGGRANASIARTPSNSQGRIDRPAVHRPCSGENALARCTRRGDDRPAHDGTSRVSAGT